VHFEMKCSKPLQLVMPRIHMLPIWLGTKVSLATLGLVI
jgi:hypothetical protein